MTNQVKTELGSITVIGYEQMVETHPTRARVLRAMINLEINHYLHDGSPPKQSSILLEVNRLGGNLASSSVKSIQTHIQSLIKDGHVRYLKPPKAATGERRRRGRGGVASPWRTVYVNERIKTLIHIGLNTEEKEKQQPAATNSPEKSASPRTLTSFVL